MECPIRQKASSCPDAVAVVSKESRLSYRELDILISSIAQQLSEEGIQRHTRVAVLLDSSVEYVVLLFALFRLQGIAIAVNTRFPKEIIPDLLSRIECDYILCDQKHIGRGLKEDSQYLLVDELVWNDTKATDSLSKNIERDQHATIIFSSGSTGVPKAILHSFGNHYYSALGSNRNIVLKEGNQWLLSLPLYHVAGIAILFRSFIAGSAVVIPDQSMPIEDSLGSLNISHASLVATQLQQIVQSGKNYPNLKAVLVGGSSVSTSLRKQSYSTGLPVFFSYGLSEMSSQVTTTSLEPTSDEILSSGSVLPFRSLHINDDGLILVRGDTLFLGYVEGKAINLPLDDEGWFSTGDIGKLNSNGLIYVLGRKDNMFISGGENIYPEQIERVIQLHPGIENVMVVPIGDERFGKRPVAFVNTENLKQTCKELRLFLEGKLARYMHPISYLDWKFAPEKTSIKDSRTRFAERAEELLQRGKSSSV